MLEADVHDRLRRFILEDLLRDPGYPLTDDEALVTGGLLDSFAIAQIGVFAEREFNVYIPDSDMTPETMDTLRQMVQRILRGETTE
jgi:acyl carrier protein